MLSVKISASASRKSKVEYIIKHMCAAAVYVIIIPKIEFFHFMKTNEEIESKNINRNMAKRSLVKKAEP